jgi:hypothetical protein
MRTDTPTATLEKVRRWNATVPCGSAVRVLDAKRPWTGYTQSLAYIDDDNRVVVRVLCGNPTETVTLAISELRPIDKAFVG